MQHTRPGRVYRLRIQPPTQGTLFPDPFERIQEALTAGNRTTRYGREWIVGQTTLEDDVLTGRIGFQGEEGSAEIWNESTQDFEVTAIPSGLTAPFAIDIRSMRALVQPRGNVIRVNSLVGAFESLLTGEGKQRWRLVPDGNVVSLESWKKSVDRIVAVRFVVRKPNPHYRNTPDLQALIEQTESDVVSLEARAVDGLDLNAPFIEQSEEHIKAGYGDAEYRGVRQEGSEEHVSLYSTSAGAEEDAVQAHVDPETGEVPQESLRQMINDNSEHDDGRDELSEGD